MRMRERRQIHGIRRAERGPGAGRHRELGLGHGCLLAIERLHLLRAELSEPAKARHLGVAVDAQHAQARGAERHAGEVREDLEELELIVEIVLEPEDDLLEVSPLPHERVSLPEVGQHVLLRGPAPAREVPGADLGELVEARPGRHRAVVQHVPPREQHAFHAAFLHDVGRAITIGDEQTHVCTYSAASRAAANTYSCCASRITRVLFGPATSSIPMTHT
jgi:hypothetical protein